MPVICPAILASSAEEYHRQMEKIGGFAQRIQIDLTDGQFTAHRTVEPEEAWWPVGIKADFHLMYSHPHEAIEKVLQHRPHMIIVHAEANGDFMNFVERLKHLGIKAGVALLPRTPAKVVTPALDKIDHVLVFSGNLGEYGGHANLDLLTKVRELKQQKPSLEVGWDGGVNQHNISQLVFGGVDVFDVGGYLQDSPDPEHAYNVLNRITQETGTT